MMSNLRRPILLTVLACLTVSEYTVGAPRVLPEFKEFDRFPAQAAGYTRGEVVEYAPSMAMYSIAYNRFDNEVQSAVTIYIKPKTPDVAQQIQGEESAITAAHVGARVTSRESIVIKQGDASFEATVIRFEFEDVFARNRQAVSSLLLLSFQPDATFKVRATAPAGQSQDAEHAMLKLLENIRWRSAR
jgi:hypothetical protein